jgi:hypothetical protein
LRSDVSPISTYGVLKVPTNDGFYVGAGDNLKIDYASTAVNFTGRTSNSDMNLYVNKGGTSTQAINISGTTANVTVPGNLAVTNHETIGGTLKVTGVSTFTTANVSSGLNPTTDNTINIGSSSYKFNTIYVSTVVGSALSAVTATVSSAILPSADGTVDIGSGSYKFDDVYGTTFRGNLVGNVIGNVTGNLTGDVTGNILTTFPASVPSITKSGTDGSGNIGQSSNKFNYVHATYFNGTSIQAQYADLAERFAADVPMVPGTVVELGGIKEITAAVQELSETVFGVISTKAAFLMNGSAGSDETHPPVAVNGRVPVRVIGQVKKGDRLVSAGAGLARAASRNEITAFNVIGRALEDKTTDVEGTVEAIVKLNS